MAVIASFANEGTEDIFDGRSTKAARRVPKRPLAHRRAEALDARLRNLATPGNNLEKLKGTLAGKYSIRVNDQFRIVFNFDRGEATNVTITDYHR